MKLRKKFWKVKNNNSYKRPKVRFMMKNLSVEERIKILKRTPKNKLSLRKVAELSGISQTCLFHRAKNGEIDYKNKRDILKLIEDNIPLVEGWYDTKRFEEETGIKLHNIRKWARDGRIKSRKCLEMFWFSPELVEDFKEQIDRIGGIKNLLSIYEAAEALGVNNHNLRAWKEILPSIQPGGEGTILFFPRDKVI